MPYPGRPVLDVLPEFVGTASTRQTPQQRERLLTFCAEQYRAGRSIHELAELTGRTQSVLCTCQWPTWKLVHRARVERPTTQVTGLRYLVSNE